MSKKTKPRETILMYSKGRMLFVCAITAALFCAIIGRLYFLQVVRSDKSAAETEQARSRVDVLQSKRGSITDAKGNLLATSSPIITVGSWTAALTLCGFRRRREDGATSC